MLSECLAFSFPATSSHFERALGELRKTLGEADLPAKARFNVEVVFEEIVTNIVRHAGPKCGEVHVEASIEFAADRVLLSFTDDGPPFDPCRQPEPGPFGPLAEVRLGGLGISLVRKASTSMQYARTLRNQNVLTVTVATLLSARERDQTLTNNR